jgi:hypothetical protein
MLAHSPLLPLVIDYAEIGETFTRVDEENIKLALRHYDRVRRIRFATSRIFSPTFINFLNTIDREFPILEYLYINPAILGNIGLVLPETFRAPKLRHLILLNFALPVGSSLLASATGLITFWLDNTYLSTRWHPADLLHRLSLMPNLQRLGASFGSPVSDHDFGIRTMNMPNVMHVILPNLRWLVFRGVSTYMEAILPHMSTPRLERLNIFHFNELTIPLQNLQQLGWL